MPTACVEEANSVVINFGTELIMKDVKMLFVVIRFSIEAAPLVSNVVIDHVLYSAWDFFALSSTSSLEYSLGSLGKYP